MDKRRIRELTAGLDNPERDPSTGVFREKVSGYDHSKIPGMVRIPSSKGTEGGQIGVVDPQETMAQTVIIGDLEDGGQQVEVDPRLFSKEEMAEICLRTDSAEEAYRVMAIMTQEKQAEKPQQSSEGNKVETAGVFFDGPAAGAAGQASEVRKQKDDELSTIDEQLAELQRRREATLAMREELDVKPAPTIKPTVFTKPGKQLFDAAEEMGEQASAPEPTIDKSQNEPEHRAGPVRPPSVKVVYNLGQAGQVETRYHEALLENDGQILVLVYDRRFEHGSRYYPPIMGGSKAVILTVEGNGRSAAVCAYSVGVQFAYLEWDFLILPVDREATKAANQKEG